MKNKKIFLAIVGAILVFGCLFTGTFANAEAKSYFDVVNEAIAKYGSLSKDTYGMATGLVYGEFIDFDNNGTEEILLIYRNQEENDATGRFATVQVYAMIDGALTKVFDEGVYSELMQTDVGYTVYISEIDGKTYLAVNTLREHYIENGDVETVTVFSMSDGKPQKQEFLAEVEPWWDTWEIVYRKCMIDGVTVSAEEYKNRLNAFLHKKGIEIFFSDTERYDGVYYHCTPDGFARFLEEAKSKSVPEKSRIMGTLNEIHIQDGLGEDVQCLILKLDSPQEFAAVDSYGEEYTAKNVNEIQLFATNYTSSMNGRRVEIESYSEIFEGHTFYHILPLVMNNAVIKLNTADITVTIDGVPVSFDQPPIIQNGRTLVPLRKIFEKLGAKVDWNGATSTITATKGDTVISLSIGSNQLYVNGKAKTLDVPACIVGGRTLVPVRAVSECFGYKVDWEAETRTVIIITVDKEAVINYAKNLHQINEDLGGAKMLSEYAQTDAFLYNTLNDIDVAIATNDFTLDMVSVGTKAAITAAQVVSAANIQDTYKSLKGLGSALDKILTSDEMKDVAVGVLKDDLKQRIFDSIGSSVPDTKAFILALGRNAGDKNLSMIIDLIELHSKLCHEETTYADAVAYITLYDTLTLNRSTMKMAVQVLSDELPKNFWESLAMSTDKAIQASLEKLFGEIFSDRKISQSLELYTDIVTGYLEYACTETHSFYESMKALDHPAVDEWLEAVQDHDENIAKHLGQK